MKLEFFFAILFALMVLQILGARLQVRQYQAAVRRLRQRGNVGIGGRKGRFGPGCIVLLACSGDGTIVGAEVMQGMTIFSRFRPVPDLYGQSVYNLKEEYESLPDKRRRHYKGYEQAVDALIHRLSDSDEGSAEPAPIQNSN
ncbi:MAG: transcriptional regulator GutM [Caecibacter massiliensis]|nr:transcriptional regulator GutM [Caecibacter massiliensis]